MSIRQPDRNYTPPLNDPSTTATADWDKLRNEYMMTRDELTEVQADLITKTKIIEQQEAELVSLRRLREEDRNEAISLRTSLVNAADIILKAAERSKIDRKGGDPFAPRAIQSQIQGEPVPDHDQDSLENLVGRLGHGNIIERRHESQG